MTLMLELSDETAARAQLVAQARGVDLKDLFTVMVEEAETSMADDDEPDWEIVAAGREALEDARAGRLLTLEDVDRHMEEALAAVRARRAASASCVAVAS